jgi:hypothetical protein
MFIIGNSLFMLIPNEANERILLPGKVLEHDDQTVVAEFAEPLTLAVGAEVNLYGDFRGRFYQQGAAVIALRQAEPPAPAVPIVALRKVGEIAAADSRGSYRVSTAALNVYANIGEECSCRVLDISPEGFAAITTRDYPIGSTVRASLVCEGLACSGHARVQTLKVLPNGQHRYGFLAPDSKTSTMRKVLGHITATVQRIQLRRLSRIA